MDYDATCGRSDCCEVEIRSVCPEYIDLKKWLKKCNLKMVNGIQTEKEVEICMDGEPDWEYWCPREYYR